jgi:N-glycosylase/DNA lyase
MKKVDLNKYYSSIKKEIVSRLNEFKQIWEQGTEKDIFAELCFCVCTPQSNAKLADKAIKRLKQNNVLYSGNVEEIRENIYGVRFPNNKAKYIYEARAIFLKNSKFNVREKVSINDLDTTRHWLVKNIKGIGYKEASHFLRNIGFGDHISILDRHILRNLCAYKVIDKIPDTITEKKYFEIENKMKKFSQKINIPMSHLDFVFWHKANGEIFK